MTDKIRKVNESETFLVETLSRADAKATAREEASFDAVGAKILETNQPGKIKVTAYAQH